MNSEKEKVDWNLKFFREVLGLESLHFGLFKNDPLNLEGVKRAQKRYTEELVSIIPEGVDRVLDAGCGTGETSLLLRSRGYKVECLNSDSYQEKIFRQKPGSSNIVWHRTGFENFTTDNRYDLILMSESSQYMDTEKLAGKAAELLEPGGWLLAADYFRKEDTPYYRNCKVKSRFISTLTSGGFSVAAERDITHEAAPTLEAGRLLYEKYGLPVIDILSGYIKQKYPLISRITSLFFRKKISRITYYLNENKSEKLDAGKFIEKMEYLFILLKKEDRD